MAKETTTEFIYSKGRRIAVKETKKAPIKMSFPKEDKPLSKMNKAQLTAKAEAEGFTIVDEMTKAEIIELLD